MQSILLRHFWRNLGKSFLLFMGYLVLFGGIRIGFRFEKISFFDLLQSMYAYVFGLFIVIGDSKSKELWLPEAIYMMPVSRTEREQATKFLFRAYWVGMCLLMMCTTVIPTIGNVLIAGSIGWKTGCLIGFQIIMAFLTACPFLYIRYIEIVENKHMVTIVIVTMINLAVNITVLTGIMDGEMGMGWFLFCAAVCVGIVLINIWFYKRFYKEMVQFYSEYESCKRIIDIKNLKTQPQDDE